MGPKLLQIEFIVSKQPDNNAASTGGRYGFVLLPFSAGAALMPSFPLFPNFEVVGLGLGGTAARRARELSVHSAPFALHRNLESK